MTARHCFNCAYWADVGLKESGLSYCLKQHEKKGAMATCEGHKFPLEIGGIEV